MLRHYRHKLRRCRRHHHEFPICQAGTILWPSDPSASDENVN